MTLAVAWLRRHNRVEELVVAADSRLRSALVWDAGPKIIVLPRSDAIICFAGETVFAYPMLLQLQNSVAMHRVSRSRRSDLYDFKGFVLKILNGLRREIREEGVPLSTLGAHCTLFILAGYSWRQAHFALWSLHYQKGIDAFTFRKAGDWGARNRLKRVIWIGDEVRIAKTRLTSLLKARGKLQGGGIDMEPFEVLRDIIREELSPSIGGPIQVAKVYRHLNVIPFGVYWPNKADGVPTVFGRALLDFEKPEYGMIDPDTLRIANLIVARDDTPE